MDKSDNAHVSAVFWNFKTLQKEDLNQDKYRGLEVSAGLGFFAEIGKLILQFIWKCKGHGRAK